MVKRICTLLLALLLLPGCGLADLKLRDTTPAQKALKTYLQNANGFLSDNGEEVINRVFDEQNTVVELGITVADDAFAPEHVTLTVYLYYDTINYILLRVDEPARFAAIAAAFRQALNPQTVTAEEALKIPSQRAKKAIEAPTDSFEDEVEEEKLNGTDFREFYAYFPNQYHDGVNWMQLMIIFPMKGYWNEETGIIDNEASPKTPDRDSDQDAEYDGYYSTDDYEHLRIFTTATPEPDSAAAEYDDFYK